MTTTEGPGGQVRPRRTDNEIIQTAQLMLDVDRGERSMDELDRALDALGTDIGDRTMMLFAGKLLQGLPYRFVTDNAETVSRARSVAQRLDVVVTSVETDGGTTSIRFDPRATVPPVPPWCD